jgi:ATP-dependent Lon protease
MESVHVACVPIASPMLSKNGQKLITGKGGKDGKLGKEKLFGYGCSAKISGVEGRGEGAYALVVEGTARVSVQRITRERPYFEADVKYEYDEGMSLLPILIHIPILYIFFC